MYTAMAVLLTVASAATHADDRALGERLQADVRTLLDASYGSDPEPVLRLTHPAIIEELGGSDKARAAFRQAMGTVKRVGLKIEKFEFPSPPTFVEGERRRFAIIPTRLVVSAGQQHLDSRNFQVGVYDPIEKKWTYVEGSKFDAKLRSRYFTDFPTDYEFPATTRLGESGAGDAGKPTPEKGTTGSGTSGETPVSK
jgi:hypothetical protein